MRTHWFGAHIKMELWCCFRFCDLQRAMESLSGSFALNTIDSMSKQSTRSSVNAEPLEVHCVCVQRKIYRWQYQGKHTDSAGTARDSNSVAMGEN